MAISLKSHSNGTSGTIQLNGTDVATISSTGITAANIQPTLVGGESIKTINGVNILGSGNLTINSDIKDTLSIGDIITTTRELSAPDWLPTDGQTRAKSSFTALQNIVYDGPDFENMVRVQGVQSIIGLTSISAVSKTCEYIFGPGSTYNTAAVYKRTDDTFDLSQNKLQNSTTTAGNSAVGAFQPDGAYLIVSAQSGSSVVSVHKRNVSGTFVPSSQPTITPSRNGHVLKMEFSADGVYLAIAYGNDVSIFKRTGDTFTEIYHISLLAPTLTQLLPAEPTADRIDPYGVQFSNNGQYIIVSGRVFNGDGAALTKYLSISIFKLVGDTVTHLQTQNDYFSVGIPTSFSFSPDDKYVLFDYGAEMLCRTGDTFQKVSETIYRNTRAFPYQKQVFQSNGEYIIRMYSDDTQNPIDILKVSKDQSSNITAITSINTGVLSIGYAEYLSGQISDHNVFVSDDDKYVLISFRSTQNYDRRFYVYTTTTHDSASFRLPKITPETGGVNCYIKAQ